MKDRLSKLMPSNEALIKLAKEHPAPESYWDEKENPFLAPGESNCTSCGGRMIVSSGDEGTQCYMSTSEQDAVKYKVHYVLHRAALQTVRKFIKKPKLSVAEKSDLLKLINKTLANKLNSNDDTSNSKVQVKGKRS